MESKAAVGTHRRWLLVLITVALVFRLGAVFGLHQLRPDAPVTYEHGRIASNLLAGNGFSIWFLGSEGPTSQQAPIYPLLIAGSYLCFGEESTEAILAIQILQSLCGAITVWLLVRLSWTALPEHRCVGWSAGWILALHPTQVYAATHIQVVVLATFLLTLFLYLAMSAKGPFALRAILLGLVGGLLILVDPILGLAIPVGLLAFALNGWKPTIYLPFVRTARNTCLAGAVVALVMSPWIVRNYLVHQEFVPVKSTFGYAFWQGNNPSSCGTDKIPKASVQRILHDHDGTLYGQNVAMWEARHETLYIDDVLLKPNGYQEFQGLTEPQRSRLLGQRAWQFVCENPKHYLQLCSKRIWYFLVFDATNPKSFHPVYRVVTVVWLVLACVGAAMGRFFWRELWPIYVVFLAVTVFHTLTISSIRFRLPIEPISLIWVGLVVGPLVSRLLKSSNKQIADEEIEAEPISAALILQGPHHHVRRKQRSVAQTKTQDDVSF